MTIEILRVDERDSETWNGYVERSPGATGFHRQGFLETVEAHSGSILHQFIGYKGEEPVGIFPVFEVPKGPITTAFSPAPRLGVPYLGPAMVAQPQAKQRKITQANKQFIQACLDSIQAELNPGFIYIKTTTRFSDPRPFQWRGFDATPLYTYEIPLGQGVEDLEMALSRSLRQYNDSSSDDDIIIEERGSEAIDFVIEKVAARYRAQNKTFSVPPAFLHDLREALPDGWIRTYVGTINGEDVSGVITLETPECAYFLQGGTKSDVDYPINDLLHWEIACALSERSVPEYDLMGANVEGIARYKEKFNPTLTQYLELEHGSWPMRFASGLYRHFR